MVYDADVLTIAGGQHFVDGQWNDSNRVYQLNVGSDGGWVSLPSLPHNVCNPMLACDDRYLYVLGGEECKQCIKLHNNNRHKWITITDLPVQCDRTDGGVLVINNTVLVVSPLHHMYLNTQNGTWIPQEYNDTRITHRTPVWFRGRITASVVRGADGAHTVECYNSITNTWSVMNGTSASAGPGRFLSMKY